MTDLHALLDQTIALHHHLCPRQVIGVRMGMLAGELLNLELPQTDKRLYTFVETDGCFADGVAVATGCWLGHRTMRLMDYGKVAATFVDAETGHAVRIWPHPQSRQRAAHYVPNAPSRWQAQLEAYQIMPADELLCAEEVHLNLSMQALISKAGIRTTCAVCGEEILNEREVVINGQTMCRSCADGGYYQFTGARMLLTHHE
jgi:formylmethanofuran dehydrogenase subunit E